MYDYLVVGSGLFGSVFARQAADAGKKVLVIDKRPNIAGNVYTEKVEGINFHKYGAHIFHTNNTEVWNYVNPFCNVQPVYEFTGCKLQRGIVFHAFQYVHLQQDVGRCHTGGSGCQN